MKVGRVKKVQMSVGVFAFNEEKNIRRAILSILNSRVNRVEIEKIWVISSGSYDGTNNIVRDLLKRDKRIRLLDQVERRGKSAAINRFLTLTTSPIVVTMSSDLKLTRDALEEIGVPFLNEEVGMVGAHPLPISINKSAVGKEVSLLWKLHHEISLIQPKCGEMVAFRNVIRGIPHDSAVDEATIEVLLKMIGYKVTYAPRAIVYNRGPKSWGEYIRQRRRVQAGHHWVYNRYNYKVVTMQNEQVLRVALLHLTENPNDILPMARLGMMEIVARMLGWIDYYVMGKNPYKWRMINR